jgi:hypothetical protein
MFIFIGKSGKSYLIRNKEEQYLSVKLYSYIFISAYTDKSWPLTKAMTELKRESYRKRHH